MNELTDFPSPKDCFLESVNRCAGCAGFLPAFYHRFLSSSHEVREKFQDTDFEQQNRMLLRSLRLSAGATAGRPESLRELRDRAETHDRHHLNIEPRLYDLWLKSIIDTAPSLTRIGMIKWNPPGAAHSGMSSNI